MAPPIIFHFTFKVNETNHILAEILFNCTHPYVFQKTILCAISLYVCVYEANYFLAEILFSCTNTRNNAVTEISYLVVQATLFNAD